MIIANSPQTLSCYPKQYFCKVLCLEVLKSYIISGQLHFHCVVQGGNETS